MAGRLSFSIAVNLLTDGVKTGANRVNNSLRAMQMQVLTFAAALGGASIGFGSFASKLLTTARETTRVTTALKNVSVGMLGYAKNQQFVNNLAEKYGVEVLALTGNFAKFTAAANSANVTMDDQKKIFEAISRASVAYSMTAEDTNLTFLAITQMMSKGKISSEELRRQLGERLPIAMAAMAKAAGVPIQKLDKLLQDGKLISNEVLPKFADALNEMIPNVNTNNIETSINRLKNTFTDFTRGTGVAKTFKSVVDSLIVIVRYATTNVKEIVNNVIGIGIALIVAKLFSFIRTQIAMTQLQIMRAAKRTATDAGLKFDEIAWKAQSGAKTMKTAFIGAANAIRTALVNVFPMAIFIAIGYAISRITTLRQEANRIKSIVGDYKAGQTTAKNTTEVTELIDMLRIVRDTNVSYDKRKGALQRINELLSTDYKLSGDKIGLEQDINKKIQDRIKLLQAAAEIEYNTTAKLQAEEQLRKLEQQKVEQDKGPTTFLGKAKSAFFETPISAVGIFNYITKQEDKSNLKNEIEAQKQVVTSANKALEASRNITLKENAKTVAITEATTEKTDYTKLIEDYKKNVAELDAQLKYELISKQDYNKQLDDLDKKTLINLATTKRPSSDTTLSKLEGSVKNPRFKEMDAIESGYYEKLKELSNQKEAQLIDEKQYNNALNDLIKSTMEATASLLGASANNSEFYKKISESRVKASMPELKKRDTTFDYKKNSADIAEENLSIAKENLDKIKELYDSGAKEFADELNEAMGNVKTLDQALKIAQVKQDIKELKGEINKGIYAGVKDVASSADKMVNAFSSMREIFKDNDYTGWEKILAVWNVLTSTIDSFLSILEMVQTLTTLINGLAAAKQAAAIIDTTIAQAAVAESAEVAAAKVVSNAAIASSATTAAAALSWMAYASMPFVGAGFATNQIIAMKASIAAASIPVFQEGGIVGGNSYSGDKILARLNSGEMVLNESQQSTLFSMLNNKTSGGGEVQFKIRGTDLVGTLSNYSSKKGRLQ